MKDRQLTFDFGRTEDNAKKPKDDFCFSCNKTTTKYFKNSWYRCEVCNKPLWQAYNNTGNLSLFDAVE